MWKRAIKQMLPDNLTHAVAMARFNDPLLPILEDYARQGAFIDIGANTGVYTHRLRNVARKVIAFEPIATLAATLQRRYPDIEVHTCALSNQSGEATLYLPSQGQETVLTRASLNADANPGFALEVVTVTMKRLDDFGIRDSSLIKIDVEGHERAVLEGAVETIRATRPALLVEVEERHHPGESAGLLAWIEQLGYSVFFHDGSALASAAGFDFARWQPLANQKDAFGGLTGPYVNNFLCLKRDENGS
jgi:FkbM family methyltransferase